MKLYFISPLLIQKIILWIPSRYGLKFFCHWKISGLENLKGIVGPVIFACNHTSELDPFFVPASLPFFSRFSPIFYTSRESKFYNNSGWRKYIYGGLLFKLLGSYPVHVGLNDYEKSLAHHIDIIHAGGCLCIFPEGRITPDGTIQQAKGGVAFLAHKTNTLIIPVRIDGTFHISLGGLLTRRHHVSVAYGKPMKSFDILSVNPSLEDYKNYAQTVMAEIGKL